MGVESFFIHAITNGDNPINSIDYVNALLHGGLKVVQYTYKTDAFIFRKTIKTEKFVINNLVILDFVCINRNYALSFEACFSCYAKAKDIIYQACSILEKSIGNITISYSHSTFSHSSAFVDSRTDFECWLDNLQERRLKYYMQTYGVSVEILPNEFFRYYRSHCKRQKGKDS